MIILSIRHLNRLIWKSMSTNVVLHISHVKTMHDINYIFNIVRR
jgi:hypothetical protein